MSTLIDFISAHTPNGLVAYLVLFSLPIIAACLLAGLHEWYQRAMTARDERKRAVLYAQILSTYSPAPVVSPSPVEETVLVTDGEVRSTLTRIRNEGGFIRLSSPVPEGYQITYVR